MTKFVRVGNEIINLDNITFITITNKTEILDFACTINFVGNAPVKFTGDQAQEAIEHLRAMEIMDEIKKF